MAKVICTLPNASSLINGVKFVEHEAGVISEEISDEAAAIFTKIKGYVLEGEGEVDEELAALRARAEAVALKIKGSWGKERLAAEVTKAEAAAAKAGAQTGGDGNTGA